MIRSKDRDTFMMICGFIKFLCENVNIILIVNMILGGDLVKMAEILL